MNAGDDTAPLAEPGAAAMDSAADALVIAARNYYAGIEAGDLRAVAEWLDVLARTQDVRAAAGPRAGDTAPDDGICRHGRLADSCLDCASSATADLAAMRAAVLRIHVRDDRFNECVSCSSDDAGHEEPWPCPTARAVGVTPDDPARVLPEERAAETADELPATLRTVEDVAAARTVSNMEALIEWTERDGDETGEFFRHDGYVLTVDDLRRAVAAIRAAQGGTQ